MTVPYAPLFDDIRRNHGFVDLRGRPDLAARIAECSKSQALRELLVELSTPDSPILTLGCDLGTHGESKGNKSVRQVAGGYVQLMCASYENRSPDDYTAISRAIAEELEEKAQGHNWDLRFMLRPVFLKLDQHSDFVGSVDINFFAASNRLDAAIESRENLISAIQNALSTERLVSLCRIERDEEVDSEY